ncbi:MAG: hypothetical protein JWR00_4236 [Rubritepida sp.]|nr:hypothetical protein [Rubritepida sp.]
MSISDDQPIVAAVAVTAALDRTFPITYFRGAGARSKQEELIDLTRLAELVRGTTAERKDLLPWLKLARFGDVRSDKASLRHDRNVLAISGLEADYDGGTVSFDAAMEIACRADLLCLIYTSQPHRGCTTLARPLPHLRGASSGSARQAVRPAQWPVRWDLLRRKLDPLSVLLLRIG